MSMEEVWLVTWREDRELYSESKIERYEAPETFVDGVVEGLVKAGMYKVMKARVE